MEAGTAWAEGQPQPQPRLLKGPFILTVVGKAASRAVPGLLLSPTLHGACGGQACLGQTRELCFP